MSFYFKVDAVLNIVSPLVADQEDQPSEPVSLIDNCNSFASQYTCTVNKRSSVLSSSSERLTMTCNDATRDKCKRKQERENLIIPFGN